MLFYGLICSAGALFPRVLRERKRQGKPRETVSDRHRRYADDNADEVEGGERDRQRQREHILAVDCERHEHDYGRDGDEHQRDDARKPGVVEKPARVVNRAERENQKRFDVEVRLAAFAIDDEHGSEHRERAQNDGGDTERSGCYGGTQDVVRRGYGCPYERGQQYRDREDKTAEFKSESVIFNIEHYENRVPYKPCGRCSSAALVDTESIRLFAA